MEARLSVRALRCRMDGKCCNGAILGHPVLGVVDLHSAQQFHSGGEFSRYLGHYGAEVAGDKVFKNTKGKSSVEASALEVGLINGGISKMNRRSESLVLPRHRFMIAKPSDIRSIKPTFHIDNRTSVAVQATDLRGTLSATCVIFLWVFFSRNHALFSGSRIFYSNSLARVLYTR